MRIRSALLPLALLAVLATSLDAQESVEDKLRPSVVLIKNDECFGSGMFLDTDGLILTNAHVACSPLPFRVQAMARVGGNTKDVTFSKVQLLGFHPDYDLALLRIDPAELGATIQPVTIAPSVPVRGERVWAVGYPSDYDRGKVKVATWGEMRSSSKDFFGVPYFEVDISIYHGNSGGPLCNEKGQVVGVATMIVPTGALAVPIAAMRPERFGALKDRTPNREMSTQMIDLAESAMKAGGGKFDSELVMMCYESALLWDSGNAELYSKVGQLNLRGGRYPAAVAYLTRSLQMQPWPEKAETYRSLGIALASERKADEALAIFREGLEKYPLGNAELWSDIAAILDKEKHALEAAYSARVALKTFTGHAGEMNEIYRRCQGALSNAELSRLREMETDLDNHLGRMRAAADKARRDGKPFLNLEAQRVVQSMTGVQKETLSGLGRIEVGKPSTLKMSDEELEIRFIRSRIEVAREHLGNGRTDEAIAILEDLIKTYPANPETEAARVALKIIRRR